MEDIFDIGINVKHSGTDQFFPLVVLSPNSNNVKSFAFMHHIKRDPRDEIANNSWPCNRLLERILSSGVPKIHVKSFDLQ